MRVAFASDDTNEAVEAAERYVRENHELVVGSQSDVWPVMAAETAEKVASGEADLGVLMCWTGTGTAIAANKVEGVRAAQAPDAWTARNARRWNDANILTLSLKRLSPDVVVECVQAFLDVESPDPEEVETIRLLDGK